MTEPERHLPSNLGWPNIQQATQQPLHTFQAFKDWNWFQASPTNPWSPNPSCTLSGHASPVQHYSPGYLNSQFRRIDCGQNHWRNRKKHKEPEFSHFCDTCDRGFKNQVKYNEHIAQHIKCSFEDCKYTAHEKLVKIHWKNTHAPGTKRIKLDTPEEIAKWREERKRNYPTQSNIKKKIELIKVKEKRGDVLETSQFGRFKRCNNSHSIDCRDRGFQTSKGHGNEHKHIYLGTDKAEQAPTVASSSYDEDPLGALATSDPDSEEEESGKEEISVAPKKMTSAFGLLMSSYGEDGTESDEEPEDALIVKSALALKENKALLAAYSNQPNRNTAPKPAKRPSTEVSVICHQKPHLQPESHSQLSCGRKQKGKQPNKPRTGAQKCRRTLLEMLLAPDIRHERNVVLQCIRYIIHKEFFGITQQETKR